MENFAIVFSINRKTNEYFAIGVSPTIREKTPVHISALTQSFIVFRGVVVAETIFQAEEMLLWEAQAAVGEHISASL